MRVTKYTYDFDPPYDATAVQVWVSFPGLLPFLHSAVALFQVAGLLGSPIRLDAATQKLLHPLVARICVELDVSQELPAKVHSRCKNNQFLQQVIYVDIPPFCSTCWVLGHKTGDCSKPSKDTALASERNQIW